METVSDLAYASVNGEDVLPDQAIGRLPAATVEELEGMVSETVSRETSGRSLQSRVVLVTDNPDKGGDFVADAEELSATVPSTENLERIYLLTMNCLNGYFHFPFFGSLAEELLKVEDKGVIAAFSPSGLSLNAPAHLYHKAVLEEIMDQDH